MCACVCVYTPVDEEGKLTRVKLTGKSSDQGTNEDGTDTHLFYKKLRSFPGTPSSTSNKSECVLQSSQLSKNRIPLKMFVGRVCWDHHRSPPVN